MNFLQIIQCNNRKDFNRMKEYLKPQLNLKCVLTKNIASSVVDDWLQSDEGDDYADVDIVTYAFGSAF